MIAAERRRRGSCWKLAPEIVRAAAARKSLATACAARSYYLAARGGGGEVCVGDVACTTENAEKKPSPRHVLAISV